MDKYADGASSSLNATITAVMKQLKDEGWRPGPGEGGLRNYLYDKLGDLTEKAYRKGFKQGHRESHAKFLEEGAVPVLLTHEAKKQRLAPKDRRTIRCKSAVPKE